MEKNSKSMINDFTHGSVPKQLIRFATPLLLSGFLQTVYNMVDMIVVGQYVGSAGLSAVSIGGEVLMLLTFVAMGISNAGQIIISQFIGAKAHDRISKLIGTMFTFLLISAVAMTAICFLLRYQILDLINTPPEAYSSAMDYVVTCMTGLIFIYGYNLVSAILRGMGDSVHPFLFIAVAAVLNLVLDLLFVAGFGMGAFGAALATVIGQAVSFIWALIFLYKRRERFGFDFKLRSFRIDRQSLSPLLKLGIPMMLQSAAITMSKLFISSWVNSYGVVASAVTGVGSKVTTITNVFAQAFSTAGGTMIAQNIGAEKFDRVPKVILTSFAINGVMSVLMSVITLLFPRAVFGIFTTEEAVLDMATEFLPIMLLLFASSALRPPMFSLINGSGNSKLNLAIALLDGIVVRIGLALFLGAGLGFGIYGFWYGDACSSFMPFIIGGIYYLSGRWKSRSRLLAIHK